MPAGKDPAAPAGRLLVVSPHFDDAVFGCGAWLSAHPDAAVVTVFGGLPERGVSTPWDRACGFGDSRDAVHARYAEDDGALAAVGAMPLRLDFLDDQYGTRADAPAIAEALRALLDLYGIGTVGIPLGLFHSDHLLASEAGCLLMRERPACAWIAYADAIYRRHAGLVEARLAALSRDGVAAAAFEPALGDRPETHHKRKAAAIRYYASQLKALTPSCYADAYAAEQYWRLGQ